MRYRGLNPVCLARGHSGKTTIDQHASQTVNFCLRAYLLIIFQSDNYLFVWGEIFRIYFLINFVMSE